MDDSCRWCGVVPERWYIQAVGLTCGQCGRVQDVAVDLALRNQGVYESEPSPPLPPTVLQDGADG